LVVGPDRKEERKRIKLIKRFGRKRERERERERERIRDKMYVESRMNLHCIVLHILINTVFT
jgi:hypothetical protein